MTDSERLFWKAALKKLAPMLAGATLLAVMLIMWGDRFSLDFILQYRPKSPFLAAIALCAVFAIKSCTIILPLTALYLAGALLFPAPAAILVNLLGLCIALTIPYLQGKRHTGGDGATEELLRRFPKLEGVRRLRRSSDFRFAFLVRVVGLFSCDIVSLYMGAVGLDYRRYLAGCVLGYLPGLVTTTLLGSSVNDIHSTAFWVSLALKLAVIFGAFTILWHHRKEIWGDNAQKE